MMLLLLHLLVILGLHLCLQGQPNCRNKDDLRISLICSTLSNTQCRNRRFYMPWNKHCQLLKGRQLTTEQIRSTTSNVTESRKERGPEYNPTRKHQASGFESTTPAETVHGNNLTARCFINTSLQPRKSKSLWVWGYGCVYVKRKHDSSFKNSGKMSAACVTDIQLHETTQQIIYRNCRGQIWQYFYTHKKPKVNLIRHNSHGFRVAASGKEIIFAVSILNSLNLYSLKLAQKQIALLLYASKTNWVLAKRSQLRIFLASTRIFWWTNPSRRLCNFDCSTQEDKCFPIRNYHYKLLVGFPFNRYSTNLYPTELQMVGVYKKIVYKITYYFDTGTLKNEPHVQLPKENCTKVDLVLLNSDIVALCTKGKKHQIYQFPFYESLVNSIESYNTDTRYYIFKQLVTVI